MPEEANVRNWDLFCHGGARFTLPMPPVDVMGRFDATVWPMIEAAACLEATNRRLAASRDLLLPRMISGELSVEAAERQLEAAE